MTELEELRLAYAECSRQRNELLTAHKRAAPQPPPDYVLVPLEPTQAMIKAGRHALSEWLDDQAPLRERMYEDPFKSAWKEAIAAAQEKP